VGGGRHGNVERVRSTAALVAWTGEEEARSKVKLETEELEGGVLKVNLEGRMDIAGTDAIAVPLASLAATDNRRVILDLSDVDFLASIGIRAILQNARAHQMRGGRLVLLAPRPYIEEVLQAAGVPNVVPIVPDLRAARAVFTA
jgi:anti-anti-sigma factor